MAVVLAVILILVAVLIGVYDTYFAQRSYADLCAARHGHIPPLVEWFTTPDTDPEVEALRRLHRRLTIVSAALVAAAVICAIYARAAIAG